MSRKQKQQQGRQQHKESQRSRRSLDRALDIGGRGQGIHGFLTSPQIWALITARGNDNPDVRRSLYDQRKIRQSSLSEIITRVIQDYHLPEYTGKSTVDGIFHYFQSLVIRLPGQSATTGKKTSKIADERIFPVEPFSDFVLEVMRGGLASPSYVLDRMRNDLEHREMIDTIRRIREKIETTDEFFIFLPLLQYLEGESDLSTMFVSLVSDTETLLAASERLIRHSELLPSILDRVIHSAARPPMEWLLRMLRHVAPIRRPGILVSMIKRRYITEENIAELIHLIEQNPSGALWSAVYSLFLNVPVIRERFFRSFWEDVESQDRVIRDILLRIRNNEIADPQPLLFSLTKNIPPGSRASIYSQFSAILQPFLSFQDIALVGSTFRRTLRNRLAYERVRAGAQIEQVARQSGMSVQEIRKQLQRRQRFAKNNGAAKKN